MYANPQCPSTRNVLNTSYVLILEVNIINFAFPKLSPFRQDTILYFPQFSYTHKQQKRMIESMFSTSRKAVQKNTVDYEIKHGIEVRNAL